MFGAWNFKFGNSIFTSTLFKRKKPDGSEDIPKTCKIHREGGHEIPFKVNIDADTTAGTIIKELSSKLEVNQDWVIVVEFVTVSIERRLEDNEPFLPVYVYWKGSEQPDAFRFLIRRDPMKFEYLRKAKILFPRKMFAIDDEDFRNIGKKSDIARQTQLQHMILRSDNVPIVFQQLQTRKFGEDEDWETKFFVLQNDVLLCSPSLTTDTSKMVELLNLKECDVYSLKEPVTVLEYKHEHCICMKKFEVLNDDRYSYQSWVVIACGSPESKLCWLTAFRMAKFGSFIRNKYYESHARKQYQVHRLPSMSERTRIAIEFSNEVTVKDTSEEIGLGIWRRRSNVPNSSNLEDLLEMPFLHPETTQSEANRLMCLHPNVNGACLIYGNQDIKFPYMLLYRVCKPETSSEICCALILKFRAKITESKILVKESETDPNLYEKYVHFYYKIVTENDDSPVFQDLLQLVEYHHLNDELQIRLTHYINKYGELLALDLKKPRGPVWSLGV